MTDVDPDTMADADNRDSAPTPVDPDVLSELIALRDRLQELDDEAGTSLLASEVVAAFDALDTLAEATQAVDPQELATLAKIAETLETVSQTQDRAARVSATREGVQRLQEASEAAESVEERMNTVRVTSKLLRELNRETYDALEHE
ncbi:hypothetical protein [Natronobiforma cellulositropha]|uniref:hypothetical protein n=1 Tax=Natronobiforma cellulositropha TaxID=1679076 RepID=UPI0021D5EAD3|nr:hypothetical protein [Natronobiforma cellulositropha]